MTHIRLCGRVREKTIFHPEFQKISGSKTTFSSLVMILCNAKTLFIATPVLLVTLNEKNSESTEAFSKHF